MRFTLHEWRKQITYYKRNNFKNIQKLRGLVNTFAFFVVWGYAGYFIANRADKSAKETGIPHSAQIARLTDQRYVTKWNLNTGEQEHIGQCRRGVAGRAVIVFSLQTFINSLPKRNSKSAGKFWKNDVSEKKLVEQQQQAHPRFKRSMSSTPSQSQLILNLSNSLREVLQHPSKEKIHTCFTHLQQCHRRRLDEEKIIQDDQLYIPAILLLRQFPRFQDPSIFDELLREFIPLFQLMPISTKKTLDDLLGVTSIILTKRIMTSTDEVQQNLFVRFFRAFVLAIKSNVRFFYRDFLGDFNRNLPILGHYLSCLLQLFERITSLDFRLDIIDTLWSLIYVDQHEDQNEFRRIIGQLLACFLPGMLKTFVQDLGSVHQRLVQANLLLLSYLIRVTAHPSAKYEHTMKEDLRDLVIERNDEWLLIVDGHIAPLLQRLTSLYVHHESGAVRRALAVLMITILCFSSRWLKLSGKIALKTMLVIISAKTEEQNETILKVLLEKLFQCEMGTSSSVAITSLF